MSGTITATRIDATDCHSHQPLEASREFCLRHGEQPDTVGWVEYDVIDIPLLRFGIYLRDADDRVQFDCDHEPCGHDDCEIAMTSREHALRGELPDWWQPA